MERSITNLRRRPFQLEDTAEVTFMTGATRGRGPAFRTVVIGSLIAGGLFVAGIVGPLMASMALRSPARSSDLSAEPDANDHPPRLTA
jgi:hypothetical protein